LRRDDRSLDLGAIAHDANVSHQHLDLCGAVARDPFGLKTIEGFSKIASGEFDNVAEQAFFNVGGLEDVQRQWEKIQKESGN
jgi:F0F1-type ATP synthase beta subunit